MELEKLRSGEFVVGKYWSCYDFGWGKPLKLEMLSLVKNSVCLIDSRDGGVEVGIVLPKHIMDGFASIFAKIIYLKLFFLIV